WRMLFLAPTTASFSMRVEAGDFVVLILVVLLVGALLWGGARAVQRSTSRWAHELGLLAFLGSALLLVDAWRRAQRASASHILSVLKGSSGASVLPVLVLCVLAFSVWRWRRPIARAYSTLLLVCLPAFGLNAAHAAWLAGTVNFRAFRDRATAP